MDYCNIYNGAYYENGKLLRIATQPNLSETQEVITFYDNGRIESMAYFDKNFNINGEKIEWYRDGGLKCKSYYINNKMTESMSYHKNGCIKSISTMSSNKLNGIYIEYFPNGKKHIDCYYVDGLRHGRHLEKFSSGNIALVTYFLNGKRNGEYTEYFDSLNQIKISTTFLNGKIHGDYKEWSIDGKLEVNCKYINGKKTFSLF